ncbi:MAG: zinc transporter ZupT [Bacteroidales bacterium]|nr:zinc transporter ZupT [Bacteroidales bacterium]MBN2819553.1 zinc transporter ZupT [Bacteroidales bacterium]
MSFNELLLPFGLTLFAGLSTGIGSTIAFFSKTTNTKFLSVSLGFSAGVMVYVSLVEIFQKAKIELIEFYGDKMGNWMTYLAFFAGILFIAIIDKLIPSVENPHELKKVEDMADKKFDKKKLMRMGLFSALAIGIHNFPEGLATFTAAITDPAYGIAIAIAIAIHNIPEGIAVSVPVYFATNDKKKAFRLSFLSGLSEPIGAIFGYLVLLPFLSQGVFGFLFASVAGIMVFISLDELLPAAREYGRPHLAIYGLIGGMMVMGASLILFI